MKKFFNVIRRNIFYIALIAGMVALVGLITLYNVQNRSEDEIAESTENTNELAENITTEEAKETIGDTSNKTELKTSDDEGEETISSGSNNLTVETEENSANAADESDTTEEVELIYDGSTSLIWPLAGNIIIPFSMETTVYYETLNQYKCNPGIVIEAQEGDEVVAAYKCEITEIESDAEYGNIVRASLGNGYEIMYGQLDDIYVTVGQVVEGGTAIATVAAPTRYYTEEGTNLYFAITKDGTPVDPASVIEGN